MIRRFFIKPTVALTVGLNLLTALPPVAAQSNGIGNGSVIAPTAGQLAPYGIYSSELMRTESAFPTRHFRLGNDPGIGSSFLQTNAPTSEGSPASKAPQEMPRSAALQFRLPKLESAFPESTGNPAFQTITPALPSLPSTNSLANPLSNPPSWQEQSKKIGPESLPSFSQQRSIMQKMEFNQFDAQAK